MEFYSFFLLNIDYFMLIIFGLFLGLILLLNKKRVELQKLLFPLFYILLYKTKWGLKKMDEFARKFSKKARNRLSIVSITVGFLGMAFILVEFLRAGFRYFFIEKEMIVAPLLPGAVIPGLPKLTFIHWIIAIFILAAVHEFSHGFFARMHNIKVKSSGFAILGIILPIIPAAFVEPDEKQLQKAPKKTQLAVLSAGTFANFITAGIFLLLLLLITIPIVAHISTQQDTVYIDSVVEGEALEKAGIGKGERIINFNGEEIQDIPHFITLLNNTSPFEVVDLKTDKDVYRVTIGEHTDLEEQPYIGVSLTTCNLINSIYCEGALAKSLVWIYVLIYWLFLTNLAVGLINLLPIGIVDGGRMFYLALLHFIKKEKPAKIVFTAVSVFLLLLLLFFLIPALIKYFIAPFR